jgi:hypothetical protein
LLTELKELRFGKDEQVAALLVKGKYPEPLTLAERDTLTWQRQLNDFLLVLERWKPEEEASPMDYFYQRTICYNVMIELAPTGVVRDRLLGEYLGFLQSQRWQSESFVEWYWCIHYLQMMANETDRKWLNEAFAASADNVLQLVAKRNKLLPPKPSPYLRN